MRKSAHMLRVGMVISINGSTQVITSVSVVDDRIVIVCGEHTYRRTPGAKIDVISRTRKG